MSRRDPQPRHPVDPTRRRRIEDPDEYERGRRDGRPDPKDPKPAKPPKDRGEANANTVFKLAVVIVGVIFALLVFGVI